ncbi:uncharacterized protein LOC128891607 [Hylaeus anthracinus]|uniref:uncharacterized protein LOC128880753 n=1 Tax=Hylaeus volcanicus TaxID=313075 RepID=UPI0023B86958|nr:uncharacterized protein LOC128880753 [Hylaeus volcanicus]XP_053987120.1 uncharacterized protein LOC128880753 [Hylaeus volcanicus]XP_054007201.1 uncharacterized protein LOC128891607 [Hylaeus anthracinus]XP_054007202.1 uncharacterized protein LOC128891607 [Hylaeus anthracinus]
MTERYKPPEASVALTKEEIHNRYQDAALVIFKEQSKKEIVNYLTFGTSRRTMEYSSYGNQPVIVRRPTEALAIRNVEDLSSQILRIYRKPRDSCVIN